MDDAILERISRIYAAIGAIEEDDPNELKATVIQTDDTKGVLLDFRGGFSDHDLSNQAHIVIHNIANLYYHLRRWAKHNGQDMAEVEQTVDDSLDLQIIRDLSNNDKHGYPPRDSGHSRKRPQLIDINRVMRLRTQANTVSMVAISVGAGDVPQLTGDGTAKAVVTGAVVDADSNRIGDLYDIANNAVKAWEQLLVDYGLTAVTDGT
jgi:hypothetical protein